GIFSKDIDMLLLRSGCRSAAAGCRPEGTDNRQPTTDNQLGPLPIVLGAFGAPVEREGAALAHRVRSLENPVLPGREPAEYLGLERLGAGEAQARLHARQRVGREARALLDREPDLVLPVEVF